MLPAYLFDRLNSYRLKIREKLPAGFILQALRACAMLIRHPLQSSRQGFLKVTLALTYRCQCACLHCCAGTFPRQPEQELSAGQWRSIIEEAALIPSLGTLVSFFGGEALLRPEIFDLIGYARAKGLFTEIETNGILLNEDTAKKLKASGLHHVFIRLEGATPSTHDLLSSYPGCFQAAVEAIKNCKKYGLSCSVSTVAVKEKISNDELPQIIRLAKSLKVSSVRILFPAMSGKWMHATSQALNKEEEGRVRKYLQPGYVYLESTDTSTSGSKRICPSAKKKSFYVSPYGQVWPCSFVQCNFGDLRSEKLADVLKKMWRHKILSDSSAGCLVDEPRLRQCAGD